MGNVLILFAIAASLLVAACGPDVEEPAGTPDLVVEESASAPDPAAEESAEAPSSADVGAAGTPISAAELADRIQAGSPPLVLDVRNSQEYARGHIPGAVNIPDDQLASRLAELPIEKSEEVVVHCNRGRRAKLAEATLRESGYSNVRHLAGQWPGWIEAGLPTE